MKIRTELPDNVKVRIDNLLRQAGEKERAGDFSASEMYSIEAWNLLPDPKFCWNFYSNIIPRDNLIFYRDTKQFDKAEHWLAITRETYGPDRNEVIEFLSATLWFEMGEFDKAFEEFDLQYKSFKTRPFQGHDKKYLDFYLSKKSKK